MKAIFSTLLILVAILTHAQKVTTSKNQRQVKGTSASGYASELTGGSDIVNPAFNKFIRDYGKIRTAAGVTTIGSPVLGGTTYDKNSAYAIVKGDAIKTTVWVGLIEAEWPETDFENLTTAIKDLVYQFGVKFYRDRIQEEIDQTQQALDATDRKLQRLTAQNKDMNTRLLDNEQEKIKLEKSLEDNKNEHVILLQKIDANKVSQDSVTNAALQIKKVLDAQKDRQQKIN